MYKKKKSKPFLSGSILKGWKELVVVWRYTSNREKYKAKIYNSTNLQAGLSIYKLQHGLHNTRPPV
jgi:hypothetical protein